MFNYKHCLLAALATTLPIAALHATTTLPIARVTFGDLNLATAAGVEALYKRVQHGAATYCDPFREVTGTRLPVEFDRCVKDAIATTVMKIDNTRLSAFHALQTGKRAS
jgi:UrcA family protein